MPIATASLRFAAAVLCAAGLVATTAQAAETVTLTHVHGLAYSADGERLFVPSHHGLAVFEKGRWRIAPGPRHDYMGFSATSDAFYSSGHPAPGSGQANPFGLIKSNDGGQTWKALGLQGESDFHLLATGHGSNAVYVINLGSNSRMKQPGLYSTRNDGLQWVQAASRSLASEPRALAMHPEDAAIVAVGAADGLYLSRDAGAQFERRVGGQQVLAVTFDLDGRQLWFSAHAGQPSLQRLAPGAGARPPVRPASAQARNGCVVAVESHRSAQRHVESSHARDRTDEQSGAA
jgi:photosystem II stability/assembly factor-like uncharacterized protein